MTIVRFLFVGIFWGVFLTDQPKTPFDMFLLVLLTVASKGSAALCKPLLSGPALNRSVHPECVQAFPDKVGI